MTRASIGLSFVLVTACGSEEVDPTQVEIAFVRTHDDGSLQVHGLTRDRTLIALGPREPAGTQLRGLGWSHEGSRLAFSRADEYGAPSTILVLEPGSEARPLTSGSAPRWSPTRLELGFLRDVGETSMLHVIDVETEVERRIGTGSVQSFDWAPEGERFVVVGLWPEFDSNDALYIVDASSGEALRIDPDPPNLAGLPTDGLPAWSPDASTIAFVSLGRSDEDAFSRIYRIDPDGTNFEIIPGQDSYGAFGPWWSPSNRLAYSYWYFDAVLPSDYGVAIVDAGTGSGSRLQAARDVVWSPDETGQAVVVLTSEGQTRIEVSVAGEPSWSPDPAPPSWFDERPAWRPLPSG